jgi:hypothetical protein
MSANDPKRTYERHTERGVIPALWQMPRTDPRGATAAGRLLDGQVAAQYAATFRKQVVTMHRERTLERVEVRQDALPLIVADRRG